MEGITLAQLFISTLPLSKRDHSCPVVQWFIGPLVQWSSWPVVQLASGPLVHWSIGPVVHWSSGPLVHWSIGPLVLCQPSYFCLNLSTFIDLFSKLISLWFACHDCITPPLQYNTAKPCSSFSLHIILSLRPYSCTEDVLFPTPARGS